MPQLPLSNEHLHTRFVDWITLNGSFVCTRPEKPLPNLLTLPGYFQAQMDKGSIPMRSIYEFNNITAAPSASEIDELADRCNTLENRISSLNERYENLKKREAELTERRWVLRE